MNKHSFKISEVSVPFLMEPSEQVELRDLGSITQPAIIYGKEEAVKYRNLTEFGV